MRIDKGSEIMRVAAIDQGTTSTRLIVFDRAGNWELIGSRRHAQSHPDAGWVEHDPEQLLRNISDLLALAGPVTSIGLANQGESCLAWHAVSGEALSPVIVWQDGRTAQALARLGPQAAALSREISGLPLDAYFSASKLGWLLQNLPAVRAAFAAGHLRLGTTDAFFLSRLSGQFVTDLTTASRTGLLDLATGAWSQKLCDLHAVPMECLPKIVTGNAGFGKINGIPVLASMVDQQAALFGHGCREPGDCKITFGTGAFLLSVAADPRAPTAGLLPTIAWDQAAAPPIYALEGGVYDAGGALEWAKKLGLYTEVDELAKFDGPSALSRGIVFVPALSGLAAPDWDRSAAPLFIGMDHATDRRDLMRAILEGIAMLSARLVDAAVQSAPSSRPVSIDGGLSQSPYFCRFLAAALGQPIRVPPMHDITALGIAERCGLDLSAQRQTWRLVEPEALISDQDRRRFMTALSQSKGWRSL